MPMHHNSRKPKEDKKISQSLIHRPVTKFLLRRKQDHRFDIRATKEELSNIEKSLNVISVLSIIFTGMILIKNKNRFSLTGLLKSTVTQNCVITLKPIKTQINAKVKRDFIEFFNESEKFEILNNLEDSDLEPMDNEIDLGQIALEALNLELPDYPKKRNAKFTSLTITKEGIKPLQINDTKPFSSLAKLKNW